MRKFYWKQMPGPADYFLMRSAIEESEGFSRFYGDLIFGLSKPVDIVDLSSDSKFAHMIRKGGVLLYV